MSARDVSVVDDAKRTVSFPGGLLKLVVMVVTAHGPLGSAAAFFKESMRRVAMIGRIIVVALWNVG